MEKVLAAGVALVILGGAAQAGLLPERVAKAAQERIAVGMYPTLIFGVVDGDKTEVVAFGKLDNGKAPDGDTVYEIGSITKTFTATLLAEEVLSGRVSLDEPVAKLLPDFKIPARNGKEITLGDIGTQHSGLPRLPTNMAPKDPGNPYADYDAAKLKAFLAGYELPRDPGASYEYSNLAFGLLGFALAQNDHTSYGALVDAKVLKPLDMRMSGTAFTDAMRAHLAKGTTDAGKPAENWDIDALAGAGAIRSTTNDMLRFLKANMGVDRTPLDAAMKFAQQPRADAAPGAKIGLAWMTTDKGIVWHNGGTGGYRSFIGFTTDGRRGVVVLTNTSVEADELGFAALLTDAPLTPAHKTINLSAAALDEYAGSYKIADKFILKLFRGGDQLFAQATGQGAFPIYPSAPNEFFAKIAAISISFTRDAKGAVNGLVLHQNGDRTAPKMSSAELPPEPKEVQLDTATLQGYAGQYQLTPNLIIDVTATGGAIEAQLTGQPAFPIFASAKDKFFYKVVDAQLDFERDATGKVVAVMLHQGGRDMRAPRIK
jgi:CubicO group peptidase (beta-lactamase class C family)